MVRFLSKLGCAVRICVMDRLNYRKYLFGLTFLLLLVSCDDNNPYKHKPDVIDEKSMTEYWHLDEAGSYWEIGDNSTVSFLSCTVNQGYVKDANVTGRIDNGFVIIKTNRSPTLDITNRNGQMVVLDIVNKSNDLVTEIPAHSVLKEIPSQCTDSIVEITNISKEQLQVGVEAEITVSFDYRLEEDSADVYVKIISELSDDFSFPQSSIFKITQAGIGSETVKLTYKPESETPHFLYVVLAPKSPIGKNIMKPHLVDLSVVEF